MSNYINPIPYSDKDITEAEDFLNRLTADRFTTEKWSLLWENLREISIRLSQFEKKWKRYRESMRLITVKGIIKRDLDTLVHGLDVDILETESAIEWGIRSSESMIDEFPSRLPYLIQTDFHVYVQKIGNLLDAVIDRTSHNAVIELLRELRDHPDIITIGQFSTNEMVEYYKHLRDSKFPDTRYEIIKYIEIYQKLCGIYAKDMILCYCLLLLKETGTRPTYEEAQPESRHPLDRMNYVKRRINSFGRVYDHKLRNAGSHTDIDVDRNKHIVTIYLGREKKPKSYTYKQIVSITQDMSALIIAFRLLMIILANRDWRGTQDLLR
ncbi:hypothetical protein MUP77_11765 [Candidatus Bathyarchaeota archaeon]|nr:hypothetical protein [Candidatus Bathyarchaeota archaeon]